MAKTLYKYEAPSNKFVWFTTWDRALRNYYTNDYNYVPDPVVGNQRNTFVPSIRCINLIKTKPHLPCFFVVNF